MKRFYLIPILVLIGCNPQKPIQHTKQPYQPKPITESYNLTTKGINLKVEIDYKLSEIGYLENNCECSYIITNLSDKALKSRIIIDTVMGKGTKGLMTIFPKLVFNIKTNDGKTIETKEYIYGDIAGGYSTESKRINANVGKNRFCTNTKPLKIIYEQ